MNLSEVELLEVCRRRVIATVAQNQLTQTGFSALQMAREVAKIVRRNLASGRVRSTELLDRPNSLQTEQIFGRRPALPTAVGSAGLRPVLLSV
jgi:hypothetical protein